MRRSFSAQIDPEDFSIPAWIRIHLYTVGIRKFMLP